MTKTILTAAILAFAPVAAMAGCWTGHDTAMSCADGLTYDPATKTCVETNSTS